MQSMSTKQAIFIVTLLLASTFACLAVNNPVRAIGVTGIISLDGCNPLGAIDDSVVYDSGRGEIFVNCGGPTLVVSDSTNKVVTTVNDENETNNGMAYDSGKGEIFIARGGDNRVSAISDITNNVVATIPIGFFAGALTYDSEKNEIFVGCENYQVLPNPSEGANITYYVCVISDINNTVVATIPMQYIPSDLVYDSGKGEIFITQDVGFPGSAPVAVISDSNNTIVANITDAGPEPYCLAYDSDKGEIFVTDDSGNSVAVISDATNSVVDYVNVGYYPLGIAYDSGKGEIYVANPQASPGANSVSVISDTNNTVIATIPNIANPDGIAYDSAKGELFVTNTLFDYADSVFGDTVTVVSDTSALATPSVSPSPTPTQQSTPTSTASPTLSVPELSWLAIVPLLLSMFSIAMLVRHRKTANLKQ